MRILHAALGLTAIALIPLSFVSVTAYALVVFVVAVIGGTR